MNPLWKKRLFATVKIAIVAAVAVWVVRELRGSWDVVRQRQWALDYYWLALSGLLYVIAYIPAALFWRYAMQSLDQHPGLYETFRAYFIGHLGKYVPGKAMVVVLRSGLLRHDRTRASVAAAAVFLETLTMMATGAFLSALIVVVWFRDMPNGGWLALLAVGMMLVAGLPVAPPVFRRMALRLGVGRNDPEIERKLRGLRFQTLGVGWLLTGVAWIFLGLSLWATIRGIGIETGPVLDNLPRFTLAAALSVVLGFVLMIPGGIGVREFAMAQVLILYFVHLLMIGGMEYPEALETAKVQAIVAAAVQRGISIVAELTVSALLIRKATEKQTSEPVSEHEA